MDRRTFLSRSGQFLVLSQLSPRQFAEMPMPESSRRDLSFSNDRIESVLVTGAHGLPVEDAIAVNTSATPLEYTAGQNRGAIQPWKSTMLRIAGLSCQSVPCCSKCFTNNAAGKPRFTSIWL